MVGATWGDGVGFEGAGSEQVRVLHMHIKTAETKRAPAHVAVMAHRENPRRHPGVEVLLLAAGGGDEEGGDGQDTVAGVARVVDGHAVGGVFEAKGRALSLCEPDRVVFHNIFVLF